MNKAVMKKKEKIIKTHCPFCSAPLIEELGVKRCANSDCTFVETKKSKQESLIK